VRFSDRFRKSSPGRSYNKAPLPAGNPKAFFSGEKLLKSAQMQADTIVEPLWKFGSERSFFG
jgi:hypothetical protein